MDLFTDLAKFTEKIRPKTMDLFQAHHIFPLEDRFSTAMNFVQAHYVFSLCGSFFKDELFQGHLIFSLQGRNSYKNCFRHTKIFHF